MGAFVSVLLAVKDGARDLDRTLASMEAQTLAKDRFEVLAWDDGSTDDTRARLRAWEARGVVRLAGAHDAALGLTRTLNRLATAARGAYLARLDCGDLSAPERLARQAAYLDGAPSAAVVCSSAILFRPPREALGPLFAPRGDRVLLRHLAVKNPVVHGSVMMRADVLRALGGYDETRAMAQDMDLWFRVLRSGREIHWLKEPLYWLELPARTLSSTRKDEQAEIARQIRQAHTGRDRPRWRTHVGRMSALARVRALPVAGAILRDAERWAFELRSAWEWSHVRDLRGR